MQTLEGELSYGETVVTKLLTLGLDILPTHEDVQDNFMVTIRQVECFFFFLNFNFQDLPTVLPTAGLVECTWANTHQVKANLMFVFCMSTEQKQV